MYLVKKRHGMVDFCRTPAAPPRMTGVLMVGSRLCIFIIADSGCGVVEASFTTARVLHDGCYNNLRLEVEAT